MTKDQITRLAKEAGIYHGFDSEGHWDGLLDFQLIERRPLSKESIMYGENRMFEILERFAALVATHEREQCLQIVDDFVDVPYLEPTVKAIRARGQA